MEISNFYEKNTVLQQTTNTNVNTSSNTFEEVVVENKESKIIKPKDISFDSYKKLSKEQIEELFPLERDSQGEIFVTNEVQKYETDYQKAQLLKDMSYKLEDETLGKVLFDEIKNRDMTNEFDKMLVLGITLNVKKPPKESLYMDFPEFRYAQEKVEKKGGDFGDYINEYIAMNKDYEKNRKDTHEEMLRMIDDHRTTTEDYFNYIEDRLNITKKIIEKRQSGTLEEPEASKPPSKSELYYEQLVQAHKEIELEYKNRIALQNSPYDNTSSNIQKAFLEQYS